LDTGKKVAPLRCANSQKKRNRSTPGSTFLPESAGSEFLSCFVLAGTGWYFTQLVDSPSEPFCRKPFFEKAKVRNLEISRPYRRPFPKVGVFWRPILILNSWIKAYQKMVTAAGSMGSKSKPTRLYSVQPIFSFFNPKIKNGKRSGYKK
jgi:hypothetical protein